MISRARIVRLVDLAGAALATLVRDVYARQVERITDDLADTRGGDYTNDPTDAGYYAALDDIRAGVGLPPTDRRKREATP